MPLRRVTLLLSCVAVVRGFCDSRCTPDQENACDGQKCRVYENSEKGGACEAVCTCGRGWRGAKVGGKASCVEEERVMIDECGTACPPAMTTNGASTRMTGAFLGSIADISAAPNDIFFAKSCVDKCNHDGDCAFTSWVASALETSRDGNCRVGDSCCEFYGAAATAQPTTGWTSDAKTDGAYTPCAWDDNKGNICEAEGQFCRDIYGNYLGDWECQCRAPTIGRSRAMVAACQAGDADDYDECDRCNPVLDSAKTLPAHMIPDAVTATLPGVDLPDCVAMCNGNTSCDAVTWTSRVGSRGTIARDSYNGCRQSLSCCIIHGAVHSPPDTPAGIDNTLVVVLGDKTQCEEGLCAGAAPAQKCVDTSRSTAPSWQCECITGTGAPGLQQEATCVTPIPQTPAPATDAPPTDVPPTQAPPTIAPPTKVPSTLSPPTPAPPTDLPPTPAPPTDAPPTRVPSTPAPATDAPPTDAPPTQAPPTIAPPTKVPSTPAPATPAPLTDAPPTPSPPTLPPLTPAPTLPSAPSPSPPTAVPASPVPPTPVPQAPVTVSSSAPGVASPTGSAVSSPAPLPRPVVTPTPGSGTPTGPPPSPLNLGLGPGSARTTPAPALSGSLKDQAKATQDQAAVAAVVTLLSGSSAGAANMLAVAAGVCDPGQYDPSARYGYALSPLQLTVNDSRAKGALVGNIVIAIGVGLLGLVVSALTMRFGETALPSVFSDLDAKAVIKFPSAPLIVFAFLYQGTSLASIELVMSGADAESVVAGLCGVAFCVAVPLVVLGAVIHNIPEKARVRRDETTTHPVVRFLIGDGEWVSRWKRVHWVGRWASCFRGYRADTAWFGILEYGAAFAISASQALFADELLGCGFMKLAAGLIFLGQFCIEVTVRPHLQPRNNVLDSVSLLGKAIAMCIIASGYFQEDVNTAAFRTGGDLLFVCFVIIMIRVALDLIHFLYVVVSGRRRRLQEAEFAVPFRLRVNDLERTIDLSFLASPDGKADGSMLLNNDGSQGSQGEWRNDVSDSPQADADFLRGEELRRDSRLSGAGASQNLSFVASPSRGPGRGMAQPPPAPPRRSRGTSSRALLAGDSSSVSCSPFTSHDLLAEARTPRDSADPPKSPSFPRNRRVSDTQSSKSMSANSGFSPFQSPSSLRQGSRKGPTGKRGPMAVEVRL
eukprot:TRINITY_DN3440_c0_g1_i1.p1 TRINITY_DN3440_c0_g1~~TRINITY_DN3440_c0_g1_i1.p1  ORF type:complete len:1164 (+),score=165.24 TRINITY_DN3440_c0_g1_i1:61-3552(+)